MADGCSAAAAPYVTHTLITAAWHLQSAAQPIDPPRCVQTLAQKII